MAKKVKIKPLLYKNKKGKYLELNENYEYEMIVYQLFPTRTELYESKVKTVKTFQGTGGTELIEKGNDKFLKVITLLSAPLKYLEENNFKLENDGQNNNDSERKNRRTISKSNKS